MSAANFPSSNREQEVHSFLVAFGHNNVNLSTYKPVAEFGMNTAPNNTSIASASAAKLKYAGWTMEERARMMEGMAMDGWVESKNITRQICVVVVPSSDGS